MTPSAVADGLELGEVVTGADGHRAELVVAPASPWLAGHFPGHPVLPAVAQLAVAERLHRAAEERGQLAGVDAMRFAAPVAPGDRLVARLTACDEDGRARWRLERADGGEVATGTLVWGSPSADAVADPPEPIAGVDDGAPAALPHAGAARLVERFALHRPSSAIAAGAVPVGHAAVVDGTAPAFLAIELAAQAAAQVPLDGDAADGEGAAAAQPVAGEPRLGYLVRMRDVRFARARIEAGAPLLAHVDLAGRTGPLARFDFTVVLPGGEPVAGGSLATWRLAADEG